MEPLANKLRPKTFDEVIGQSHLVGEKGIIRLMVQKDQITSMILFGPPGTGKTTIANIIAENQTRNSFYFHAATDTKAMLKEHLKYDCVLIIDEIHRMNKDIQDTLLPYLESGQVTMIGLTTVSPYHSVNPAIRSRAQIFECKPFNTIEILDAIELGAKTLDLSLPTDLVTHISQISSNELRSAYNYVELCSYLEEPTVDSFNEIVSTPNLRLDKNEDSYYELLSGLQKSIRGSDVDASLHYAAKLITLGDLESLMRRLIVIAYEDIGLANPDVGARVLAVHDAVTRLGLPEARIPIANIVVDLALSPKSNSAYLALDQALADIKAGHTGPLPKHLKQRNLYKYPHDYPFALLKQQYLPDGASGGYYEPKETGKYEQALKERYKVIKEFMNK